MLHACFSKPHGYELFKLKICFCNTYQSSKYKKGSTLQGTIISVQLHCNYSGRYSTSTCYYIVLASVKLVATAFQQFFGSTVITLSHRSHRFEC